MIDEEYEDDEEYDEFEELDYQDAGRIYYTMLFQGDRQAVEEARDFAQSLRNNTGWCHGENTIRFEQSVWGALIDYDGDTDDAVYAILDRLAVKVAKKYPHVAFSIRGKIQYDINEGNYGAGGVVVYPPTWYHDFLIEYKDKHLTYQVTYAYESIYDARDDIEEGFDFEGCGPLSQEEISELIGRYNNIGESFWVCRGSIYEDGNVPIGTPIEYKIDWDKKD